MMGFCEIEGHNIRHLRDNLAAARFYERTPAQTSGKLASELGVSSSVIEKWLIHIEKAKTTGKPQTFEYAHEASGKLHFLSTTLSFLGMSKDGKPQLSYTLHDLTDLKQAESQIVSSKEDSRKTLDSADKKFNLVLSLANVGVFDRDLQTNRVHWSDGAKHILGLPSLLGEQKFQFFMERLHAEDREELEKEVKRFVEEGSPINTTFRFYKPDNKMIWIQLTVIALKDQANVPQRTFGVIKDIIERRLNQESLRAAENRYRSLFQNMTEEVHAWHILFHEDGTIKTWMLLDANPAALKTWGRKLEDVIGKTTDEIFGEGSTNHYIPVVQKILSEKKPYTYEDYFSILNRHFRFTSFALGDMFFTTGSDITEEKKSREDLKQALNVRDEFISIASHELKTPLTALKLQVQLQTRSLKLGRPEANSREQIDEYNEKVEEYVNRLERLVNDMLDISRIRTGKLTIIKEKVDLCIIAKEIVDRMQIEYKEAGGDEIKFLCSGQQMAYVDSMRIEQVLSNLLQNALKYAKGKSVELSIVSVKNAIRIKVVDQGMGISPDIQSNIFDRFTLGISAYEVSCLGLGLFISQQIIHAHNGKILVESRPGKGASFSIEIPSLENV